MSVPAELRVGWCPGVLRPMASGDGLILRVKPRGAALTLAQAGAVAEVAARHGNGQVDLTARANLQIRGVGEARLAAATVELAARGLLDDDAGAETRRNVVTAPLAGLDPAAAFDIRPAVAALEARLAGAAGLAALPDKFGIAVSDGGAMPLDDVSADLRCEALPDGRFALRLDGDGGTRATCAADDLPDAAVRLAGLLAEAAGGPGGLRRMRDLVARDGAADLLGRAGLAPSPAASPPRRVPRCIGVLPLGAGTVLGVAAPFGRLDATQLAGLVRSARRAGAGGLRVTPWRTLLVPGLSARATADLASDCAGTGLVTSTPPTRGCASPPVRAPRAVCAGPRRCATTRPSGRGCSDPATPRTASRCTCRDAPRAAPIPGRRR